MWLLFISEAGTFALLPPSPELSEGFWERGHRYRQALLLSLGDWLLVY